MTTFIRHVYLDSQRLDVPANPLDLGGLGVASDGSDQTDRLNSIFATYGGRAYYLARNGSGNMLTSGTVNMPNGGVVTLADDVVWEANAIRFDGSIGTVRPLTARVAIEATDFPFDSTGIAVGDWIYVFGCTNLGSADAGAEQLCWSADLSPDLPVYPGQWLRARTIAPTVVTVTGGARWNYEITPGSDSRTRTVSQAWKVNPITGGIRGGTIMAWSGSTNFYLVDMKWAAEVFLDDINFDLKPHDSGYAVRMQRSLACRVTNCTALRHMDSSVPGQVVRNSFRIESSQDIECSHNRAVGGNQAFDISVITDGVQTSASFDCSLTDNTVISATEGLTSHNGSTSLRIDRNTITDCRNGISLRSQRSSVSYNTIINTGSQGAGIYLLGGFFDGTTVLGNIVEQFQVGLEFDLRSSGALLPFTVTATDNVLRNSNTAFYIVPHATISDATIKAIVIRGGSVIGVSVAWTNFGSYSNGLSIEDVTFVGPSPGASVPGVIRLPANTTDVYIGTNYYRGITGTPCIYGPGATVISDLTVYPAGESEARWTIREQKILSGVAGPQSANMPTNGLAYAYAPYALPLRIGELGRMVGTNASAASTILAASTTVAHVIMALNQLLSPPAAVPILAQFDFMPGTMPGGAALARASVGWSLNAAGVLVSNAINVARFQHSSSATVRGLLNEAAQTVTLWNSQTLVGASRFTVTGAALTAGATTAPTGAATGNKLVEDTSDGLHVLNCFPSVNVVAGTSYTLSVFAKAGERTIVALQMTTGFPVTYVYFDLVAGSYAIGGLSAPVTATMTPYPGGWYRCSISAAASSSAGGAATINLSTAGLTGYTGDGVSGTYLWGAQFSAIAGSYIDTTTAAVTRSPDVLTLTVAAGSYIVDLVRESGTVTVPGAAPAGSYVVPTDPSPLQQVIFR